MVDQSVQQEMRDTSEDPENADYGGQASEFELTFLQKASKVREDESL